MKNSFKKLGFTIFAFLLSSGIMYSQTSFWEPASIVLKNPNLPTRLRGVWTFAFANNGDVWAVTPEGIFVSTDNGDIWVPKNNGLPTRDLTFDGSTYTFTKGSIYSLAINPINGSIFAGGMYGLYRSTDNGENWTTSIDLNNNIEEVRTVLITLSGDIYVGITRRGVFYSKDNGNTWTMKNKGLSSTYILSLFMGHDGTLYASTAVGIYHSTDGGDNWLLQQQGPNINLCENGEVVAQVDGFVVSADGSIFAAAGVAGVIKSTDKGVTWNQLNTGLNIGTEIDTVNTFFGVVYIPVNVAAIAGIAYSPITDHLFVFETGLYGNFIYRSTNLGAEWQKIGMGGTLAVNPKTGMVFVGRVTEGTNVYRSTPDLHSKIISVNNPTDIPTEYSLSQNYPNPFNPTTKIQYSLPEASNVKLSIYNNLGQEVMQLVNETQSAGKYIIDFNAQNLQSGVYFYRLQTGKSVEAKKMLLLK